MTKNSLTQDWLVRPIALAALMIGITVSQFALAATITVNVENESGNPVAGFRYLVEEDTTYKPNLGVTDYDSLSFNFHKSHNPVAPGADGQGIRGTSNGSSALITVPDGGNYYVSVLPFSDHALGGIAVENAATGMTKTVRVNANPIPTAQISIQIFEDISPLNGAWDQPVEKGLSYSNVDGKRIPFSVLIFDAAGQYGMAGGQVTQDAYGNPLGTEYDTGGNITSTPDSTNGFILTPDENGYIVVKNLPPAKYGVQVVPPVGAGWVQTSTIEGTKTIDAWVKANEPEVFVEFGPPGPHVFIGYVQNFDCFNGVNVVNGTLDSQFMTAQVTTPGVWNPGVWITDDGRSIPGGNNVIGVWQLPIDPLTGVVVSQNEGQWDPEPQWDQEAETETVEQVIPKLNCPDRYYTQNTDGSITPATSTGVTLSGQIVSNHMSRSPDFNFANGKPFDGCRIAVNEGIAGRTIYSQACDAEATFTIDNVPGNAAGIPYSLSIWDDALDVVIANHPFTVTDGGDPVTGGTGFQVSALTPGGTTTDICTPGSCDFGQIPVFDWNSHLATTVFYDENKNGYRDVGEPGLNAAASSTNIRWRDGRIYKSAPIDLFGEAPHNEVFPFFHWLVAEVDFATYKSTGATMTADAGSDPYGVISSENGYIPQAQSVPSCTSTTTPAADGCTYDSGSSRTETGTVLTQAFQGFLGQTNTIEFGKTLYLDDDPATPEDESENGGITGMAIYAITRAENDPRYAVAEAWEPGIPRVQMALYNTVLANNKSRAKRLDATGVEVLPGTFVEPDVDNYPLGWSSGLSAKGNEDVDHNGNGTFDFGDAIEIVWTDSWDDNLPTGCQGSNSLPGVPNGKCFDGLRNWNQIRPGVFDGGYSFSENLTTGYYIVQSFTPPGYELMREEHKNVDFGDEYAVPQLLPPLCVGTPHTVPTLLSFRTDDAGNPLPGVNVTDPDNFSPEYGSIRPNCDLKQIRVAQGKNAAANFHYLTDVPKAAHVVGGVINDLANEFNPNSPTFGEKFAPPWLPVAFYDYNGNEVNRVYTDQFGKYNAMLPSTYTVNVASPSGVSPNMLTACMNDAGSLDAPDPYHNPQYSQFCYTFQFMPGATTYLDTPVMQIAAFASAGKQLDCEAATTTPMIKSVIGDVAGPWVTQGNAITITSRGIAIDVPNPSASELDPNNDIARNYGFGTGGVVELIDSSGISAGTLGVNTGDWTDLVITATVPATLLPGDYQLVVDNGSNASPMGVTLTVAAVGTATPVVVTPNTAAGATPIQDAIDLAIAGDLILVAEGIYNEMPVMHKPVRLQGAGAYSTIINARKLPAEKVEIWQAKILALLDTAGFALLDGQGPLFETDAGPGLMVAGNPTEFAGAPSRIDGFTVTGGDTGGGVFINGYTDNFVVSNNLITGNQGTYGGGIRVGHAVLTNEQNGQLEYTDAQNDGVNIHHNFITQNGNYNGAGAGISLYSGSDNYNVSDNMICGNFAGTDGAGIGHKGLSNNGNISDNQILFNQSFKQASMVHGGGILIAGQDPLVGAISDGTGAVDIIGNLIQGNQAGAGDGGGIALYQTNGDKVQILHNSIVNNVAGWAGGGISLIKDATNVDVVNNTIVNNQSTATAFGAFSDPALLGVSTPQVAGIIARGTSTTTKLDLNIVCNNRSSYYVLTGNSINDAGVRDLSAGLTATNSLLTTTLSLGNPTAAVLCGDGITGEVLLADLFETSYANFDPGASPAPFEFQTIAAAPAVDEGGNWIDVRYAPLSINDVDGVDNMVELPSDYHLKPATIAQDRVAGTRALDRDIDGDLALFNNIDIGSDEVQ